MDFNDFVEEFENIYVCKSYTEKQGWYNQIIHGAWKGEYAEGLPNKENKKGKKAQLRKNPQYGITINKPCKGIFMFRLKEKINAIKAVQKGYILV